MSWTDSFHEQLLEDSAFLRAERRLDTDLVDKLILQLNRIYPQILTDKEATRVSPVLLSLDLTAGLGRFEVQSSDAPQFTVVLCSK